MEFFKPVEIREYYIKRIASGLKKYLYDNVFAPIFEILDGETAVLNDKTDRNGCIHSDVNGQFISKNGDNLPVNIDIKKISSVNFSKEKIKQFEIKGSVKKYYQEKIQGNYIIHPELGMISFTAKGLTETINKNKSKNLYILTKIPEILKKAKFDRMEDKKHERTDGIKQFYLLYGKVKTENKEKLILIKIAEDFSGNKFFILKPVQTIKNSLVILPQFYREKHLQRDYEAITIITDFSGTSNPIVNNSKDDLLFAIKMGKVYYKNGAFRTSGKFTNAISKTLEKMGAKFKNGAYYIDRAIIPLEYIQALSMAEAATALKLAAIDKFLASFDYSKIDLREYIEEPAKMMFKTLENDILNSMKEKNIPVIELNIINPKNTDISEKELKTIRDYWKKHERETKKLNKELERAQNREKQGKKAMAGEKSADEIQAELNELNDKAFKNAPKINFNETELDYESLKVAQDYTYNMQYWVTKWETKKIIKMREEVLEMVKKGERKEKIKEYFEERWGIAENKAEFLAKNESHLAGSIINKAKHLKIGCTQFKWMPSSTDEPRRRELHKEYYGKIFDINNPPIIDKRTGQKGLPRQIWNCLCHILYVVPSLSERLQNKEKIKEENSFLNKVKNAIFNNKQFDNNVIRYRRFGEGKTL